MNNTDLNIPFNRTRIPIAQAGFPAPFPSALEFNPPVHGTWNIVHIGMLLPQAHQIYVCSENCMRGVVMTAAEMNALDRFSCVTLEEHDLYSGNLEEITLEGVTDVLNKLAARRTKEQMPRAVLVFPVCLHHFMGCDLSYVYGELEKRFPGTVFVRCWMDPIMQKSGPTPDQKLRRAMMDLLRNDRPHAGSAPLAFLGDLIGLDPDSELMRLLMYARGQAAQGRGYENSSLTPLQIQDCRTLDTYISMGSAQVLACRNLTAYPSLIATARRLGRRALYLPLTFDSDQIRELLLETARLMLPDSTDTDPESLVRDAGIDTEALEAAGERALNKAHERIGDTPVSIDSIAVERPLGLAKLLVRHGFNVREIYLDSFNALEEREFNWLKEHVPELLICGTIQVEGRVLHGAALGGEASASLAIGPKAAWYNATPHFVNMVYDGGLWGYSGICKLAELMCDAYVNEKDTRELVPRKGLGCTCIL